MNNQNRHIEGCKYKFQKNKSKYTDYFRNEQ